MRSGILDSIHAFGASTLGVPFVSLIGLMIAGSVYLVVTRRDALRSEHRLDSLLSREAVFLANNLVLVGLAFVVFWGTFFPLISEAVTGTQGGGRAAVVRPLHGAAGARARAAVGHRAGDRLAPGDAGQRAAQLPVADGRPRLVVLVGAARLRRDRAAPTALIMFVFAAFVVGGARPGARGAASARGAR